MRTFLPQLWAEEISKRFKEELFISGLEGTPLDPRSIWREHSEEAVNYEEAVAWSRLLGVTVKVLEARAERPKRFALTRNDNHPPRIMPVVSPDQLILELKAYAAENSDGESVGIAYRPAY